MKGLISIILCLLFVSGKQSVAQYANYFTALANTRAPIHGSTFQVYQDTFGFIWVGTTSGLNRYDGYDIRVYQHDRLDSLSLPGNNVRRLFEDHSGRLWITIDDFGLCVYNRDEDNFIRIRGIEGSSSLHSTYILDLIQDRDSLLWVAGNAGLQYALPGDIDLKNQNFTFRDTLPGAHGPIALTDVYTRTICVDSWNNVWTGTSDGIEMIPASRDFIFSYKNSKAFPDVRCSSIIEDDDKVLWFMMFNSPAIFTWDPANPGFQTKFPEIQVVGDSRAAIDLEDRLWITWLGDALMVIEEDRESYGLYPTNKPTPYKSTGQFLRQPSIDHAGNLWLAGGAYIQILPYTGKKILNFEFPFESGNEVSALYKKDSLLLVGQLFGGLVLHNLESGQEERILEESPGNLSLTANRVYSIREMRDGKFLITTSLGAQIFDLENRTMEVLLTGENLVRWSYIDPDGAIWLFLERTGLLKLTPPDWSGEWLFREDKQNISLPRQMVVDEQGGWWIASMSGGMAYFHPEKGNFRTFEPIENDSNSISGHKAECIHLASDGMLWIGTRTGLNKYDRLNDSFSLFTSRDGMAGVIVKSILEDDEGNLWLVTDWGISKFNPGTGVFTNYNTDDGFINRNFYPRAAFHDADGTMYFGGSNGVDAFKPWEIGINHIAPKVVLSNFLVKNKSHPLDVAFESVKKIELEFKDDFFEIVFTGLHFTTPSKIRYAYKLEGFHDEWVDNGTRRSASFTGLWPGSYSFKAKASNGDNIWSDNLEIKLYIHPPFYLTWWFFILCGLTIFSTGYGVYRYRVNTIRKEARLKAEFDKKLAQVEMQALRAQMNPHFLFNSLNSVKSFIGQNKTTEAQEYLTAFAKLVRQVLNNSRQNTVRLYDDLQALELYMKLEQMRMSGKFDYTIEIGDEVNPDFAEVPPLLLQPFVENAIKHGLRHKENGQGKLNIYISREGERLHFSVEDNGIGREKARQLQSTIGKPHNSMGIKISEERMAFIKNQYGEATDYRISDLKDEEGNASGTRVDIWLPVAS